MKKSKHSSIGASSCERWWNCPGSIILSEGVHKEQSSYAATGQAAHQLCELGLRGTPIEDSWIGEVIEVEESDHKIPVTEEMVESVNLYIETIEADLVSHDVPISALKVEVGFCLEEIHPEAYGTCDAAFLVPYNRIIVYDFKYGAGIPVEITDNKQLLYYALGAFLELIAEDKKTIQAIEVVIIQPRAKHKDGVIRRAVYSMAELSEFHLGLVNAVQRIVRKDESLQTGKWCRFCPAQAFCPAIKEKVYKEAVADFFPQNKTIADTAVTVPLVNTLTPEQIATVLDNAVMIQSWVKSVLDYAHTLAENGSDIPGYKLAEGRSNRQWVDEQEIIEEYELEFGEALYAKKVRSPAQMEKLLGKKRASEITKYVTKPQGRKVLVPVSDGRAELPSDIHTDFSAFLE